MLPLVPVVLQILHHLLMHLHLFILHVQPTTTTTTTPHLMPQDPADDKQHQDGEKGQTPNGQSAMPAMSVLDGLCLDLHATIIVPDPGAPRVI